MAATEPAADGRAAAKAKSRQAILDAAAELMERRRSVDFPVEALAQAAAVSRRTVFNHFASVDDVVTEATGRILVDIVDRMRDRAADAGRAPESVLDDLAATTAAAHLVPAIAYLMEVFAVHDERRSDREGIFMQRAFSLFNQRMSQAMAQRHPEADPLRVDLVVAAFGGGVLGLVDRWIDDTGGVDTPASRRAWDELIATLTSVLSEPSG